MRILFLFLLVVLRVASTQAQPSCNVDSEFKGSTEPAVLAVGCAPEGGVAPQA